MKRFRRDVLTIIMVVYIAVRVLMTVATRPDILQAQTSAHYAGQQLPATVCIPDGYTEDTPAYYPTLYAVIPSMMVAADQPCELHLTP